MPILRLAASDAETLGVPETVSFNQRWSLRTVGALRKQTGYSIDALHAAMDGFPVVRPDGTEVIEKDYEAWAAWFWMILYSAGHKIPWKDFDLSGIPTVEADVSNENEGGDGSGKAATSAT